MKINKPFGLGVSNLLVYLCPINFTPQQKRIMLDFKINGFTDAHTQCDRCGRNELKGTFNIETTDGQVFHLGSSCIKKAYQMTQKEFYGEGGI